MKTETEKHLVVAHLSLSMISEEEFDPMFADWLVSAKGSVQALLQFKEHVASQKKE